MKSLGYILLNPKVHTVAFALTCTLLVGGGWEMKSAIDGLSARSDEMEKENNKPSQFFMWLDARKAPSKGPMIDLPPPPLMPTNWPPNINVS
jgi:hypothetical protein